MSYFKEVNKSLLDNCQGPAIAEGLCPQSSISSVSINREDITTTGYVNIYATDGGKISNKNKEVEVVVKEDNRDDSNNKFKHPKYKEGTRVKITKQGLEGSKYVKWEDEGKMDIFENKIAKVKMPWYDGYGNTLYTLEGIDGIEKWVFGEDNLTDKFVEIDMSKKGIAKRKLGIKDIVYLENQKKTVVKFADGTYSVAICEKGDIYDKQKGLMICLLKRYVGNEFIELMEEPSPNYLGMIKSLNKLLFE